MTSVRNPILTGCYPDPTIERVGNTFYLVTSTFEYLPGLPIFESQDLVNWRQIGHVIDRPGQLDYDGIPSSGGLYAPTLRYHDGTFWLICTLVDSSDPERGGNFVVTATDPAGPWSDPIWLNEAGIDPSIFFDDDGRVWMHGTRLAQEPEWFDQTEVWVREFDPVAMELIGQEHVIWNGALRNVVWAEGPHIYLVDGTYYLLAAEGGTEFHHAVSVARAESVTGPYIGNKANPVLTHRHLGHDSDVVGVGHADLVQAQNGSWWAVLLAMRPYGGYHYNLGRETFLVPVTWEDGWPVFAPGVGRVPEVVNVPFAAKVPLAVGASFAAADDGEGLGFDGRGPGPGAESGKVLPQDPRWTSLRRMASEFATPNGEGWDLAVRPTTPCEPFTPALLAVRQQHVDVAVSARVRCELAPGEEFGLIVRQSEDDHVRIAVSEDEAEGRRRVVVVHRQGGSDRVLGEAAVAAERSAPLTVWISARGQDYSLGVESPTSGRLTVATANGRTLDSVATGGFLGLWLGVYATSNGRPTTTVAQVESFEYRVG